MCTKEKAWQKLKYFRKKGFNYITIQAPTLPENWVRPCFLIYDHEKNVWCVWKGREVRVENQAWNKNWDKVIKEVKEYYRRKEQGESSEDS